MHARAVMKTLVHAHILVLVSASVLRYFQACGDRTCKAASLDNFDNWSSGSLASRAVRLASSLPKNQRVVVSCRPPRYRRKHGRRLFFVREISWHLEIIC